MNTKRLLQNTILVFGILLLLVPVALRAVHDQPLLSGSEGYGHARLAGLIAQQGIPIIDPAMPERPYAFNLFDLILAGLAQLVGIEWAALLLPFLLGMATLWCLSRVVRGWNVPQATALGVQLVFVLSPLFVDVFTQATPRALELLLLIAFVLVLAPTSPSRSTVATVLRTLASIVLAISLATFGMVSAIVALLVPMLAHTIHRRMPLRMFGASIAAFITMVAVALPSFLQRESPSFARPMPVIQAISDFGSSMGLSLFAWLLGLIGIVLLWQFKKRYYAVMIAVSAAFAASLVIPSALVMAQVLVAFLAGYALAFFARMRWSFDDIRTLTVLVLVCGLLFSTLTHAFALAQGSPDDGFKDAFETMKAALPENATVLSYPNDGFWIAYWSGKRVLLDGWPAQTPAVNERWALAQSIWHAQDISRVRPLLSRNDIGALVITHEMRNGLVWDLPEQDLLFLLQNNETFKNVYRSSSVDIWAVLQSPGAS